MAQLKDLLVTGDTRILGKVYSPEFVDKLTGNADTATKATNDSSGQNIISTYVKSLSINGKNLNIYKGDGSSSSLIIKDKIYAGNRITTVDDLNKFIEQGTFKYSIINALEGLNGLEKNDGIVLSFSWDTSAAWGHQIFLDDSSYNMAHRHLNNGTWQAWVKMIDANNYTNYTVTKTGSEASGTWGISITGNSGTTYKSYLTIDVSCPNIVYIYNGSAWKKTSPYVYSGQWLKSHKAERNISSDTSAFNYIKERRNKLNGAIKKLIGQWCR